MPKRVGRAPPAGGPHPFRPSVYALLPMGGRLVLTRQRFPCDELQLPGGGVEPGESPLRALHREVLEETGWRIAAPRRLDAFRRFAYLHERDGWAEKICLVYIARPVRQIAPPTEAGHEVVMLAPRAALSALADPGARRVLAGTALVRA